MLWKKLALVLFCFVIVLSSFSLSSAALNIKKIDKGSVVIAELDNPAKFTFVIKNNGASDDFEIYSFVGVTMTPRGTFRLGSGETREIEVEAYPSREVRSKYSGVFIFDYEIRSPANGIFKDRLSIKIVSLSDAVSLEDVSIRPKDMNASLTVRNLEDAFINDVEMRFKSKFFSGSKVVSMKPRERAVFNFPVDSKKLLGLEAGTYELTADVSVGKADARIYGKIKYLEFGDISVDESYSGFIIRNKIVKKTNEGNIRSLASIQEKRDIFTRLFTTYSAQPSSTHKSGFFAYYTWERELTPGESFYVSSITNYTFPFILVIFIVGVVLLVRAYSFRELEIVKRVSFVRTKGGELALKVRLHVKAHKHVDNIQIIDRIPAMMKIYDKFNLRPDKIDEKTRRIGWNILRLNAGEERVFSYIIYSKLNVVGKMELPAVTGIYEREGKTHEVLSNRTFFAAETSRHE